MVEMVATGFRAGKMEAVMVATSSSNCRDEVRVDYQPTILHYMYLYLGKVDEVTLDRAHNTCRDRYQNIMDVIVCVVSSTRSQ